MRIDATVANVFVEDFKEDLEDGIFFIFGTGATVYIK